MGREGGEGRSGKERARARERGRRSASVLSHGTLLVFSLVAPCWCYADVHSPAVDHGITSNPAADYVITFRLVNLDLASNEISEVG